MPIHGDTFIDIDGKMTVTAIKSIKKSILDNYLKYTATKIPGLTNNINVVLSCIEDITKEEISNAEQAFKDTSKQQPKKEEPMFMPGTIEIVNGKKYIGGKEVVEE
jgi:hypothetical protein